MLQICRNWSLWWKDQKPDSEFDPSTVDGVTVQEGTGMRHMMVDPDREVSKFGPSTQQDMYRRQLLAAAQRCQQNLERGVQCDELAFLAGPKYVYDRGLLQNPGERYGPCFPDARRATEAFLREYPKWRPFVHIAFDKDYFPNGRGDNYYVEVFGSIRTTPKESWE